MARHKYVINLPLSFLTLGSSALLVVLQVAGQINWPVWALLAPIWGPFALVASFIACYFLVALILGIVAD